MREPNRDGQPPNRKPAAPVAVLLDDQRQRWPDGEARRSCRAPRPAAREPAARDRATEGSGGAAAAVPPAARPARGTDSPRLADAVPGQPALPGARPRLVVGTLSPAAAP